MTILGAGFSTIPWMQFPSHWPFWLASSGWLGNALNLSLWPFFQKQGIQEEMLQN
jgi:hypothetical protein